MSTDGMERIEFTENGVEVTVTAEFGNGVEGWAESREDLGLNKHGNPVAGAELVHEEPHYHDESDEYPYGHGPVTLRFPDAEALGEARDHLREKATERFEWGADGEAVQDFLRLLPTKFDVEQARDNRDVDADMDQS
jgi:hypothetical protein